MSDVLSGVPLAAAEAVVCLRINPLTSLPQISEAQILSYAKHLSEDIGYRTVGTREHALGDAWMMQKAEELKQQCDEIVKSVPGRKLECEVWRQEGSGSHRYVLRLRCSQTSVFTSAD